MLGPAHIPDNLDFQATSYGSHTECRMVTTECGAVTKFKFNQTTPLSGYNFACNNTMAGLNMTGNFLYLGQRQESYQSELGQSATSMLPKNFSGTIVENVNSMSLSNFSWGFQYFNDSAKREQVPLLSSYGLSFADYGPITNTTNQYFWALAFSLDIPLAMGDPNDNNRSQMNLSRDIIQGDTQGIVSCTTNISEIVRLTQTPS